MRTKRIASLLFSVVIAMATLPPRTVNAANAVGGACVSASGVSGGKNCKITSLPISGTWIRGEAKGTTLFTDTVPVTSCAKGSEKYNYKVDANYMNPAGTNPNTTFTILHWIMRFPTDFSLTITTSKVDLVSYSAHFIFGGGVDRSDAKDTSYVFKGSEFSGGGKGLLTQAAIADLTIVERWEYMPVQLICINNSGKVTDVISLSTFLSPKGTSPIMEDLLTGRLDYRKNFSLYSGSQKFPVCSQGGDDTKGGTRLNVSTEAPVALTTTSTRTLGIAVGIGNAFQLEAGTSSENKISAEFTNLSAPSSGTAYKRILCTTSNSKGFFNDLTWSGTPTGIKGSATELPPGMLVSISTRCWDDTVAYPCPK